MLAGEGEVREALREFERAVELDPRAAYLRLEYADLLYRLRRVDEAAEQALLAKELAPSDPEVLRLYGQIQYARSAGDVQALADARAAFEALRGIAPHDITAMLTLAQIYNGLERQDEAIAVLRELVSYHPDNRQLSRVLVDALNEAGRSDEAEALLEEILRLDSEALDSRLELARMQSERGNHAQAIEILEGAGTEIAGDPKLRTMLAQEYFRHSVAPGISADQRDTDLRRAETTIDQVLAQYPDAASALFLRARIRGLAERYEEGAADLRKLLDQAPDDVAVAALLARFLEESGKGEEAAALLIDTASALQGNQDRNASREVKQQLLELQARREEWRSVAEIAGDLLRSSDEAGPARNTLLGFYVEALLETEQGDRALQVLEEEEARHGRSPEVLLHRAEVLIHLEREQKALRVIGDPVFEAPTAVGVRLQRASLLYRLKRQDEVRAILDALAAEGAEGALRAGQFYSFQGEYETALPYLERALQAGPDPIATETQIDLHFWMGQALERTGRSEVAAASFERVLALDPTHAQTLNYLGYMLADQGTHLERALELTQRAVDLEPDNGAFVDSLGWAYYGLRQYQEARTHLERAAELVPGDATVLEHLGDVYVALGELDLAKRTYEMVLQIDDEENVDQVRAKLDELRRAE